MPCPTCNVGNFNVFQNKGLQQPLYGFFVYCSNEGKGCKWQGELVELDRHLNLNPDREKVLVGCAFTEVQCVYCDASHPRNTVEYCGERPFTCPQCKEYTSTYDVFIANHAPVCQFRIVECPNLCGITDLQHQHLKLHMSTSCTHSEVECDFKDVGCTAKVCRKDLPSHLAEDMVAHMSMLVSENRKLKLEGKTQEKKINDLEAQVVSENRKLKLEVKMQEKTLKDLEMQVLEPVQRNIRALQTQEERLQMKFDRIAATFDQALTEFREEKLDAEKRQLALRFLRVPPRDIVFYGVEPLKDILLSYMQTTHTPHSDSVTTIETEEGPISLPLTGYPGVSGSGATDNWSTLLYSHTGGYLLQVQLELELRPAMTRCHVKVVVKDSEFEVEMDRQLLISAELVSQDKEKRQSEEIEGIIDLKIERRFIFMVSLHTREFHESFIKDNSLVIRILKIEVLS